MDVKDVVITRDKISLICPYPVWDFYLIEITHEVNEHARLRVEAFLEWDTREELEKIIYDVKESDVIQVIIQNEDDSGILFTGVPVNVDVQINGHEGILILECCSGTYNMDIHECSRSFQNVSMQYDDMLDFVVGGYTEGAFKNTGAAGRVLDRPVIQYKETDWQFLKRMASEVGTVLTADVSSKNAKLWLGVPDKSKSAVIGLERVLKNKKVESEYQKEHCYYEVSLVDEYLKIGDEVEVLGDQVFVTKAVFIYEKDDGILRTQYRLEELPRMKRFGNERVKGICLDGTVLDVKLDHLKIHLDVDENQAVSEAFWYPCKAEASNVWYTMPHIGERVSLYIADMNEVGLCMAEIRGAEEQMGTPGSLSKPTEKYMLTKWHQQMALREDDIELDSVLVNIVMDEDCIYVDSNDIIEIAAGIEMNVGKAEFEFFENGQRRSGRGETKNILLRAENLITMQVVETESVIELDRHARIHASSRIRMVGGHILPTPGFGGGG